MVDERARESRAQAREIRTQDGEIRIRAREFRTRDRTACRVCSKCPFAAR